MQAAPIVHVTDDALRTVLEGIDLGETFITSGAVLSAEDGGSDAFRMDEIKDVSVRFAMADGGKCERCWQILPEVSEDAPICARCADAVTAFDEVAA